ncbi:hypothetical protein GBA52_028457 [Prunus armeniaca]|nr:hypothetical protein GBA52_028457 [Prunus armeniaca]
MLSSDDGENDVFFDSVDLSSQESIVAKEEPGCSKLEYEIWMNEPPSVKERRESFLRKMGLAEFDSAKCGSVEMEMESGASSKMMGLQRLLNAVELPQALASLLLVILKKIWVVVEGKGTIKQILCRMN